MKKQLTKKLLLNKENIASLDSDDMYIVKGGVTFMDCTLTYTCTVDPPTCSYSCTIKIWCCMQE